MSGWGEFEYYRQPTIAELQKKAAASAKKAAAKGEKLEPIRLEGRTITRSWWGKAWCENLERYADYSSRITRGRRYVRCGSVIDLKIKSGEIQAMVQGSQDTPYKVSVSITPLSEARCWAVLDRCSRKTENLEALLQGDFPEEMQALFRAKDGLFPSPEEIHFRCSCPDGVRMCKHVAAALYGVGARLDENPLLFFALRGIDANRFIDITLANKVEALLQNADKKSDRVLEADSISRLFGI